LIGGILAAHIELCRSREGFEKAQIVVIPESNIPVIPQDILNEIRKIGIENCLFMNESDSLSGGLRKNVASDLPGSRTTRLNKPIMVEKTKIMLREGRIIFYDNFVVSHPDLFPQRCIKDEIITHLKNFRKNLIFSNSSTKGYEGAIIAYSGKKNGSNDDFVMALMINILMFLEFIRSNTYKLDNTYLLYLQQTK
jgi:hypothetical protein